MKTKIFTDNVQRIEFFIYYTFMIVFCFYTAFNAFVIGEIFLPFVALAGADAILSLIILISYFKHISNVPYLLIAYITLLIVTLIGSSIAECVMFGVKLYVFVSKISLYLFCILTPVKHYAVLRRKLKEFERSR